MEEGLFGRFRRMKKEELIRQLVSLRLENEALRGKLEATRTRSDDALSLSGAGNWEFFQSFMENFSSLVFACDASGRLVYVNQACLKLLGYSREELLRLVIFDLVHEDHKALVLSRAMVRLRGGSEVRTLDVKLVKKDGSICWVEMFGIRIEDSGNRELPFLLGSATDITARVEAAQALQESENRFRVFAEHLQAAIYMNDPEGNLVYVNPYGVDLLGYSREELLTMRITDLIHPDYRQAAVQRVAARLRGEELEVQRDIPLVHKDGHLVWIELHAGRVVLNGRSYVLGTANNVTERKKSEDELRRSEERFKAFTNNIRAAVYLYGEKGKILFTNPYMSELTGYSSRELFKMKVLDLVHPDFREIARRMNQETCDLKIVTKSGACKWVEVRSEKLKLQEQEMLLGNAVDITHRVESEQALRESEQKFRFFFERSSDPMLLLDEKGFFDCNAAAMRQLKVSHKDEVLVHPARLSPEIQPDGRDSREKADEMVARAYEDGFHRFEWLHCDFTGKSFWADVSLTVIPFEHRNILFVVWRDITAFKELEELLREEREQLLVTLRSIGDAVITTDLEGRIVLMNRVAEHLTGWSQAEAQGREVDEILDLVDPESGQAAVNPLRQAITRGVVLEFTEGLILHSRDGRELKVADSASPIRDEKSRIIGGVLVFRDITERERMQEEVFKLRKLESVGRLAGGIAHDFNNLLTGIIGNIEIALLRGDARSESGRENLSKALKASGRAADLTQKLLTFAKGGEPIKESADIAEIIRDSAEFPLLGSNIALKLDIPAELWAAEVDAGQISQVIQNLVINAIHAMPSGGELAIRAENLKLNREEALNLSLEPGFYVMITIHDQGCGIPERLYDRIFDPFFTTRQEGSGLGLSVVHSIVSKHGGCVMVASQEGAYTEFTIHLPALGRVPESGGRHLRPDLDRGRGCRILIMDDEEMVLEILGDALTSYGCEVTAVKDGREALACYQQEKFDLVIIDLTIPGGLGGRETIKLLREYDPGVKAVVSSGYANDPVLARYEDYGFCGRLEKPFVLEELFRLLDRILAAP